MADGDNAFVEVFFMFFFFKMARLRGTKYTRQEELQEKDTVVDVAQKHGTH